ncbi:MAG: hypothetical protein ACI965_002439 [Paraglaciecola sp.]|jgi:hypothetical protein
MSGLEIKPISARDASAHYDSAKAAANIALLKLKKWATKHPLI